MKSIKKTSNSLVTKLAAVLAAIGLLLSLSLALVGCSRPPKLEDVREEFIALIEASAEINELLWGEGLPYYAKDSQYAKDHQLYDGNINYGSYCYVTQDAAYHTVEEIRLAAAKVYSKDYLEDISGTFFDGVYIASGSVSQTLPAKYLDMTGGLCISSEWRNLLTNQRVYDFDTMKIESGASNEEIVTISISCQASPNITKPETVKLRFVKDPDGWRLDTPTY